MNAVKLALAKHRLAELLRQNLHRHVTVSDLRWLATVTGPEGPAWARPIVERVRAEAQLDSNGSNWLVKSVD